MKGLVEHLVKNNIKEIVENSLFDCHVKGLHSVYLIRKPEQSIRLFICAPNCDMSTNAPHEIAGSKMSIGFHSHHCNLTLSVWCGNILNWIISPAADAPEFSLKAFKFDSMIKGGGSFVKEADNCFFKTDRIEALYPGDYTDLNASEIHTVSAPRGGYTAWFVYQGKEDKAYEPWCFSNADLENESFEGMYWKPRQHEITDLLQTIGLLRRDWDL